MPENAPPARDRRRIVDEVFAPRHPGAWRRWGTAALVVAGAYSAVFVALPRLAAPSLADWAARVAARVHVELERDPEVTIEPPPPQPPAVPAPAVAAREPTSIRRRTATPAPAQPAPAQTARVIAQAPLAQPVDFTTSSFVVGKSATYAGGASSSSGTSTQAVDGRTIVPAAGDAGSRRRSVSLDESEWSCPWPSEAEGVQIVQEVVVLRVSVRSDGAADAVKILSDPGAGFGQATRACALRTHFHPALDDSGAATAAWSPPIRVRFVR